MSARVSVSMPLVALTTSVPARTPPLSPEITDLTA